MKVGLAGLGAVGLEVAKRLIDGAVPGLTLTAVAVRDADKARRNLPQIGDMIALRTPAALADDCDIVVECSRRRRCEVAIALSTKAASSCRSRSRSF